MPDNPDEKRPVANAFHVVILSTYVPVQLYVANFSIAPVTALWAPLGLALVVSAVLIVGMRPFLASLTARCVAVSVLCFAVMPIMSVRAAMASTLSVLADPNGQLVVAVLYTLVVAVAAIVVARRLSGSALTAARDGLNVMAAVLLVVNGVAVAAQQRTSEWEPAVEAVTASGLSGAPRGGEHHPPDIYYIVLDGYARDDVLSERYDIPQNALTEYLADSGFYVAEGSQANYSQTYLSLASSLNMAYLDPLAAAMENGTDRRPLGHLIYHSATVSQLKSLGYEIVLASSDYYATAGIADVDLCLCDVFRPTEFDALWLSRTPFGAIPSVTAAAYDSHRKKIVRTIEHLRQQLTGDSPRFVFAHLIAPHPPFVFGRDGEPRHPDRPFSFQDGNHFQGSTAEYVEGYRDQLVFVNEQVRTIIEAVMARTGGEAVVVVQSDHGPGSGMDWESADGTDMKERTSILSAYYLPGTDAAPLYPTISPVNSFRLIFNRYFDASYELLSDRSYFSTWPEPYRFVEVTAHGPGDWETRKTQ